MSVDYTRYREIRAEREARILTLTFNRPAQYNAVNHELHEELSDIFYDVAKDEETDVVVLTGAGKAFCAGGDLRAMKEHADEHGGPGNYLSRVSAKRIIYSLLDLEQPIIAKVNGPCVGLGLRSPSSATSSTWRTMLRSVIRMSKPALSLEMEGNHMAPAHWIRSSEGISHDRRCHSGTRCRTHGTGEPRGPARWSRSQSTRDGATARGRPARCYPLEQGMRQCRVTAACALDPRCFHGLRIPDPS